MVAGFDLDSRVMLADCVARAKGHSAASIPGYGKSPVRSLVLFIQALVVRCTLILSAVQGIATFIGGYSRYAGVTMLWQCFDVLTVFESFQSRVERETG